jgi:phosphoglycerol transferase MdoB-like AlkP superfamily enzyme
MNLHKDIVLRLLKQLLLLIVMYTVCRLFFVYVNGAAFHIRSPLNFSGLLIRGLRFDISAICYTNAVFIILSLLPFAFTQQRWYQLILKTLFIGINGICLLLNLADAAYFPFIQKRIQFGVLRFATDKEDKDLLSLFPLLIKQYWWLLLFFILMIWGLIKFYNRTLKDNHPVIFRIPHYIAHTVVLALAGGLTILGLRGGFQSEVLNVIHASQMTEVENIPVLLNTPFTLVKTIKNKGIPELHYYSDTEIGDCFNGIHNPTSNAPLNKQNVIVIMIESLSKKYLGLFNKEAKTPFMDSLFSEGLLFTNAYANAKVSTQGIPAILSSIPSWQDDFFVSSNYSTNKITSIANLLKPHGYSSAFFHGGRNGSMGFDVYCSLAGFEKYIGKNQYPNQRDYDGNWGIWDEQFLQFTAGEINKLKQPFISAILTLSTHTPYSIPEKYKDVYPKQSDQMLSCIRYLDLSLREFFDKIKEESWFKNTLFIFSADHTAHGLSETNTSPLDYYGIPIVFYKPDGSLKGTNNTTANQIDILPSALHQLNYSGKYFALGRDLFDSTCNSFSINYKAGVYQYFDSSYCYQFNGRECVGLYNIKADRDCRKNILAEIEKPEVKQIDANLKKMIQSFNNTMVKNEMYIKQ